jgi:amino acid adenylation domain-containing protein
MQEEQIEGFRLSPAQARLWGLQSDGRPYLGQCSVALDGEVDVRRLREALDGVVARHESLRTCFRFLPGMKAPLQTVAPRGTYRWSEYDLSGASPAEQEARAAQILEEEAARPFDLTGGPVMHVALVRLGARRHLLLTTLPSLCADASSLDVIVDDLLRQYGAGAAAAADGDGPVQYAQFSEWQHELAEDEDAPAARSFWRAREQEAVAAQPLPFEQRAGAAGAFRPAAHSSRAPREVVSGLERLASESGVEPRTVLLACWLSLLQRLTGHTETTAGLVLEGRKYEEMLGAVGLFSKCLPLRVRVDGESRFDRLVSQLGAAVDEMSQWQEYYTWDGASAASTSGGGAPNYFAAAFECATLPETRRVGGLSCSLGRRHSCADPFGLKLSCLVVGGELLVELHYDAGSFLKEDVARLSSHFHTLLADAVRDPRARVGELRLLGEEERRQLLVTFNRTAAEYPRDECIHEQIERQAERAPEATAVICGGARLTYAQLNASANRLARHLRERGVGPESLVGVWLDPSAEMLVAILGVLKAGGAYVPLDPGYPSERLRFMLEDTGARVVVTKGARPEGFSDAGLSVVSLEEDRDAIAREGAENLGRAADAQHPAYVIYTSGSTGRPKGVVVTHRNLVNSTSARTHYYRRRVGCYLLLSSFAFDSSVAGIFWTLCDGGTLLLPAQGEQRDVPRLVQLISEHEVSEMLCLPSLYALMLEGGYEGRVRGLRTVIVAGEACEAELVRRHLAVLPRTSLFNEYGPTEASVWSSVYECAEDPRARTVPIGRPVANARLYVLDERLGPVPVGAAGEIYVGGEGLARGYLNRPDLTAERFVPHPFPDAGGERLYRTGDLGRYRADGQLEFLGRADQQVKIRGYRVELGEIEAALAGHAAVREGVVVAGRGPDGAQRLVAYFVPERKAAAAASELRAHLLERLPDYMVPQSFVALDALPLMPNGKLDRHALPEPEQAAPAEGREYVAPQTEMEKKVAGIWSEVLGVERVSTRDNFFDLGGQSFLAIKVHNRLCRELGREDIPLLKLFEFTTVEGMARFAADAPGAAAPEPGSQPAQDWASRRRQALAQQRQQRRS